MAVAGAGATLCAVGGALFERLRTYTVDPAGHRLVAFDAGVARWTREGLGRELGEFNFPSAVAASPTGDVYVVDTGNHRIQVLTAAGSPQRAFGDDRLAYPPRDRHRRRRRVRGRRREPPDLRVRSRRRVSAGVRGAGPVPRPAQLPDPAVGLGARPRGPRPRHARPLTPSTTGTGVPSPRCPPKETRHGRHDRRDSHVRRDVRPRAAGPFATAAPAPSPTTRRCSPWWASASAATAARRSSSPTSAARSRAASASSSASRASSPPGTNLFGGASRPLPPSQQVANWGPPPLRSGNPPPTKDAPVSAGRATIAVRWSRRSRRGGWRGRCGSCGRRRVLSCFRCSRAFAVGSGCRSRSRCSWGDIGSGRGSGAAERAWCSPRRT